MGRSTYLPKIAEELVAERSALHKTEVNEKENITSGNRVHLYSRNCKY